LYVVVDLVALSATTQLSNNASAPASTRMAPMRMSVLSTILQLRMSTVALPMKMPAP